ncbi:methylenetetrahydrofolate reductase [Candidatus Poriferisocius sp.]|uniref:methylenetetrahydrofolate reductase n=1 Tax=Candidatus Poriferisocius sp. TaxID=3101276 RepID=UPI003B02BA6F
MRNDSASLSRWEEPQPTGPNPDVQQLIRGAVFEIIPLNSAPEAIDALPPKSRVSVTASATKGQEATLELAEELIRRGHQAIPHFSARLMRGHGQVKELADWAKDIGVTTAFVIGGDATEPGVYHDAHSFMKDLFEHDHGLDTVGVAAYPDGHPLISEDVRRHALFAKQELLAEAGLRGYCSTQMCFDPAKIIAWLKAERNDGLTLPVHLGIPGAVERTKLLSIGARLGVGQSLRYLRKNRRSMAKLLGSSAHDPSDLLEALSSQIAPLGIDGLHIFTFNQVATTAAWRQALLHS